ncbi:uncharacterized protein YdhG (YjbR/CyaY superfamily) [Flavobacterium gossypii]|uniref:Uncharacterized protein YdhG (YjbR/CyaY superfamily) n=1 Tax=Flavobacterium gossypii TaxID=1646119 RepID=A0ABR6DU37_9FLAO|nr:DUF1801 domain-containing protein [Flavobacterium gossypii]MBA9074959.1 uncharacterized protein YdhG (YjbR/CyaY superfamily) [Flavobacterium gossypii]
MQSTAKNPKEYLDSLPDDRKEAIGKLRNSILEKLPKGFEESMNYGMLCYNVPFSIYPNGYHCNPEMPLPFLSLASQKNFIALYHMGIYADPELLNWFVAEYPKHSKQKLDMGKSCIRFKKMDQIPYELIAELLGKITPEKWIEMYESAFRK